MSEGEDGGGAGGNNNYPETVAEEDENNAMADEPETAEDEDDTNGGRGGSKKEGGGVANPPGTGGEGGTGGGAAGGGVAGDGTEGANTQGEEGEENEEEQEEEGEKEQQEDDKSMSKPLTLEVISQSISLLCKIGTGLAHAYVRLDVHDKELTNITMLSTFVHLRYIDISMNSIKDISPLNCLTHMLTLKSDRNLLASPALAQLPYLQSANFAKNKIIAAEGVDHPLLETLHLSYNKISSLSSFATLNLTMLHTLELRSNQLRTTKGLVIPTLRNLYLAQNVIKYLEDVDKLCNLQLLHMRDNHIEHLDGFSENNRALQYLNLRSNHVTAKKEIQKLKVLPMLRCVVMAECPISDEDDYRVEVLIALRKKIERLDKDEYTEEERQEAEEISEQRRAEENPGGLDGQDADDPLLIDDDGLGGEPGSNEEGNDFDIDDEVDYS